MHSTHLNRFVTLDILKLKLLRSILQSTLIVKDALIFNLNIGKLTWILKYFINLKFFEIQRNGTSKKNSTAVDNYIFLW